MRRLPLLLAALGVACALLATVAMVWPGAGGRGDGEDVADDDLSRTTTTAVPPLTFRLVRDELLGVGGTSALPTGVRREALDVLERYVTLGTLEPVRRGRIGRGLERVFAAPAFAAAAGRDRAAVFDEDLPVDPTAAPQRAEAALVGLADPAGVPAVVVVRMVVEVVGEGGGLRVLRSGELTLVPAGEGWVVDAYDVRVTREVAGTTTTTTGTVSR